MIQFFVAGSPKSQGSKVRMPNGAMLNGCSAEAHRELNAWRALVSVEAAMHAPIAGAVSITLRFTFPRPAGHLKKSGALRKGQSFWRGTKPDDDKLDRAVFDALTAAGSIEDDAKIVHHEVMSAYSDTNATLMTISFEQMRRYLSMGFCVFSDSVTLGEINVRPPGVHVTIEAMP